MSRPALEIGTFGEITFLSSANGGVVARTRFRDWDGQRRLVQATAATRKLAEQALRLRCAERASFQPSSAALSPDSGFGELVAY